MPPTTTYPPLPALAPFSSLFGYTEPHRTRYTRLRSISTARYFSIDPTPTELAALTYYNGLHYTSESYGEVLGTTSGLLLGFSLRNLKPGKIPTVAAYILNFGQSGPQTARFIAVGLRLLTLGAFGGFFGHNIASSEAVRRVQVLRGGDLVMARFVAAEVRKECGMEGQGSEEVPRWRGGVYPRATGNIWERLLRGKLSAPSSVSPPHPRDCPGPSEQQ